MPLKVYGKVKNKWNYSKFWLENSNKCAEQIKMEFFQFVILPVQKDGIITTESGWWISHLLQYILATHWPVNLILWFLFKYDKCHIIKWVNWYLCFIGLLCEQRLCNHFVLRSLYCLLMLEKEIIIGTNKQIPMSMILFLN